LVGWLSREPTRDDVTATSIACGIVTGIRGDTAEMPNPRGFLGVIAAIVPRAIGWSQCHNFYDASEISRVARMRGSTLPCR
jgi:hypothetical protein